MRLKYTIVCLIALVSTTNAQLQNFLLKEPDATTDSHTYLGRDYVRLLPGYRFSATEHAKTMNAKISKNLSAADVNNFVAIAIPKNGTSDDVTAIDKTKAVGQIPISSSVSPSGAKCYNVPIEIVPGRQGFQPDISLSYNSQAGNGVVGMGWSISGLSSIERVNKTVFFDGATDIPALKANDAFALDGVRLIKNETSSTETQYNYETVTGNTKVIAYVSGDIVKFFKVYYPNGTVGEMGYTTNTTSKLSYPVTKLTDINRSVIIFLYDTTDNTDLNAGTTNEVYYITEIDYGGIPGYIADFAKVKFSYDATRADQIFSLQSSKSCVFRKRLSKIESFANPDLIRTYQLAYSNTDPRITSNQNDVSRVTQISSFVNDGKTVSDNLNPLKFYYGEAGALTTSVASTTLESSGFDLTKVNVARGKFDANSSMNDALLIYPKKDIFKKNSDLLFTTIYPNNEQLKVYQSVNSSTSTPNIITSEDGFIDIFTANIDGIGNDEVVKVNTKLSGANEIVTFKIYTPQNILKQTAPREETINIVASQHIISVTSGSPRDGFSHTVTSAHGITPKRYYTGFFTGSGKTEVLSIPQGNWNNSGGPSLTYNDNTYIIDLDNGLNPLFTGLTFINRDDELVYPIDIDGDGQTEVLHVTTAQTDIYKYKIGQGLVNIGNWTLTTADFMSVISTGNYVINNLVVASQSNTSDNQVFFSDLNGDGKIDIIKAPQRVKKHYKFIGVSVRYLKCVKCGFLYGGDRSCPACGDRFWTWTLNDYCIYNGPEHKTPDNDWSNVAVIASPQTIICDRSVPGKCPVHGCYIDIEYDWNYEEHDDWIIYFTDGVNMPLKKIFKGPICNGDSKIFIQDTDGDNVPELIVDGNLYAYRNKEHVFDATSFISTNITYGSEIIPFDINSDKNYNQLVAINSNGIEKVSFSQNKAISNQISLMTNSLGIVDKTNYKQLYQGANYTPGTGAAFPNNDFQGPMWVTTQTSAMYNKQLLSNTTYNYTGAILNKQGLGLRGFTSMKATDLMTNKDALTEFNPYQMGAITHQTSDKEEASFVYNFADYSNLAGGNKKMKLLLTNKTVTDKLKGNTVSITYSGYDDYGNVGTVLTDFGGSVKSTVNYNYYNRLDDPDLIGALYLIGFPGDKLTTFERNQKIFYQKESCIYDKNSRIQYYRKYIGTNLISETEYVYFPYPHNYNIDHETVHNKITNAGADDLTTSYTYDTDQCSVLTKKDPMGLISTYTNNLTKRLLTGVKDYLGNKLTYGYDYWRRKNSELSTVGADIITTSINFNWNTETDPNRLIKEERTTTGQSGATVQPTTTLYADAFGRETRKAIAGFDGATVYADKEYDTFGHLQRSSAPYKTTTLWTSYKYDEYDRPTSVVQPNGSITAYSYYGNTVSENKDGVITSKTTDASGMLVSSTDGGGTVTYSYRADGQPDNVNAAGVITSFEYNDAYNRQTKLIDPSAGTVATAYDDAKHTVTQTWNSGKTITTVSNKYGQPTSKTTPDFTTTYSYDPSYKRPTGSISTNGTSKVLTYDPLTGRLGSMTETVNGKSYQEVYGYDNGRIGSVSYNTGTGTTLSNLTTVVYKYNGNGYFYQLLDGSNNVLRQINSVNELGQETSVVLGNGLTTSKNYTPEGLVNHIQTGTIQDMSYDFNRINGTLNSRTDNIHRLSESFTYDNLYRLKSFGSGTMDYTANGNIMQKSDGGVYTYGNAAKPYTLSSVASPDWDLTKEINIDYTVMSRPNTITKQEEGLSINYTYNDTYDRVISQFKRDNILYMTKYYFGGGKYEIQTVGGIEKQRLYLDGSPYTASVILEKTGITAPQTYYLHRDFLGSITQITDKNTNLAAEYSYDAWGRLRNVTNWEPFTADRIPYPMLGRGYTGHEHLTDFGIINMNARLYDPLLGRFLAPDPYVSSGLTNDFNRYVYCRNNPLMYTDPSGMSFASWWKKNIADPFMREWHSVFGNGQGGWEIGYNSSGGIFTNPTYNGRSFGPSIGISNSGQITSGNSQGGFHYMSSINSTTKQEQSVISAEQNARSEYFGQKIFESVYDFSKRLYHLAFVESEMEMLYGHDERYNNTKDIELISTSAGVVLSAGSLGEEALGKTGLLGKPFGLLAKPISIYNTSYSINSIISGKPTFINYLDVGVGAADIGASFELLGSANPYVATGAVIYGVGRIGYEFLYSTPQISPTYNFGTTKHNIIDWWR